MNFNVWLEQVNTEFLKYTGMSRECWPDACYYDMWEDGFDPVSCLAEVVSENYGQDGLLTYGLEDYV